MEKEQSDFEDFRIAFNDLFSTFSAETNSGVPNELFNEESLKKEKKSKISKLLGIAVKCQNIELAGLLLKYGACVKSPVDDLNRTALQLAVILRDKSMINLLLEYKADPKVIDSRYRSLLHLVLENVVPDISTSTAHQEKQEKIIEIMEIFVDRGLDVNKKTNRSETPLYFAVQQRLMKVAKFLIEHGAKLNCTTKKGESLAFALIDSDIKVRELMRTLIHFRQSMNESIIYLKWLISLGLDISKKNKKGKSPLELAVEKNVKHLTNVFLDHTDDIFFITKQKQTILHILFMLNSGFSQQAEYDNDIAIRLIEKGAAIDVADFTGETPFHMAARQNRYDVLCKMINRGINIHASDNRGTPIWRIAMDTFIDPQYEDIQIAMVKEGVDVNRKNHHGTTPAETAARLKKIKLLNVLEEYGADLTVVDNNLENLLHHISKPMKGVGARFNKATVDLLVRKGCDVNIRASLYTTPLHMACQLKNNVEVVRALIEHGANIYSREYHNQRTPLHLAALNGNADTVECLIELGAEVNCTDGDSLTPMHMAAQESHKDVIKTLAQHGGDVNATNDSGLTPILAAVRYNSEYEVVEELIKFGADIHCRLRESNFTPLHEASLRNNFSVVKCLLNNGANVLCQNNANKLSPLHVAAGAGDLQIIRLMIDKGADIHCREKRLLTPLHEAVYKENDDVIRYLVKSGADINAAEMMGKTSLHLAIGYPNKAVKTLLELGASMATLDNSGYTPLHEALDHENLVGFNYMIEYRMDVNDIGTDENELFLKELMEERNIAGLIHHLVKLLAIGFPVADIFMQYIDMDKPEIKTMHQDCLDEIILLKKAVMKNEKESSLYSLLHMHPYKRYPFYKKKDFKLIIDRKTRSKIYPIYSDIIMASYREAMSYEKLFLTAPARDAWYNLTEIYLPEVCVDIILVHLDLDDLKRIIQGVGKYKRKKSPTLSSAGTKSTKKRRKK